MQDSRTGRLVILSGPSCVGKSPLDKALGRIYPKLRAALQPLVLYNSRSPRPGEVDGVDYHFRAREQVESLSTDEQFAVMDVRGDIQALDLERLSALLERGDVLFEGNPFVGGALLNHERLAEIAKLAVFMSPISREEIIFLKDPRRHVSIEEMVADIMRRKLLRRTRSRRASCRCRIWRTSRSAPTARTWS